MNFKKQYKKYSLITIITIMGLVIFFELTPFMSGILGAMTIYILLRKQMKSLTQKRRLRNGFAATLLLLETILLFLVPLSVVVIVIVSKIGNINLNPQELVASIQHLSDLIQERLGYDLMGTENISSLVALLPRIGQLMMSSISSFLINIFVLIFVLYFMLISRESIEKYIYEILPFNEENKKEILREINMIVTSNAIGIPLLAIIQGGIAVVGYYIFHIPNPFVFGLLTGIATVIPMVGTSLIWIPLALYLGLTGHWDSAIGLMCYGVLIISQIDNLVRFVLQKKIADIHPLITIFGVIIGLALFGFMGIIFGPLLLSMFILCFNIFKKEYLN